MNAETGKKVAHRSTEEVLSEIAGPAKEILFLSRLLRWWPSAKRQEAGKFWIYKSRLEWTQEIGAELKTFERYITHLRKGGWIETAAFERFIKDGNRYGGKIQHVRPTDKLIMFVEKGTGRAFERPRNYGLKPTPATPQNLGGHPLKNEGHTPSKMGDHKKENSSLSKEEHKNKHKGAGLKTLALSPVNSKKDFGKKEGNPSGHPEDASSPPKPLGAPAPVKVRKVYVIENKNTDDIADPLALL